MDKLLIQGGNVFFGEVVIFGVKNVVLLIICVLLLIVEFLYLINVLYFNDIFIMLCLFGDMGIGVMMDGVDGMIFDGSGLNNVVVFYEMVKIMWVLILVFGLLVVCCGEVWVLLLGGCVIGVWLVDQYIKGLQVMGVEIKVE